MAVRSNVHKLFTLAPILVLAFVFTGIVILDRVKAQEVLEGEDITIEGEPITNKSSTTEVPLKSAEQIFFELPYEVKYNIMVDRKESLDDLVSKYAKLYDSCRFK